MYATEIFDKLTPLFFAFSYIGVVAEESKPPFWALDNCRLIFLSKDFCSKKQNLKLKTILRKFRGEVEILSICCFFCRKFAVVVRDLDILGL